jgi:hypothetical protein
LCHCSQVIDNQILETSPITIEFDNLMNTLTLLDIFQATPQGSQRLIPIAFDNQCVANVAALLGKCPVGWNR